MQKIWLCQNKCWRVLKLNKIKGDVYSIWGHVSLYNISKNEQNRLVQKTIWQTYLRCCCPRGLLIWTDEKILNTDYFMVKRWLHPFGMIHWDATQFRVQWPTRENCHGAQKCVTWLTEPSECHVTDRTERSTNLVENKTEMPFGL